MSGGERANVTGKTVGDICSRTARATCSASEAALQIRKWLPGRKIGVKKGRPWI
jgi:hypothetical protein